MLQEANQQINPKLIQLQGVAAQFGGRCNFQFLATFCDLFSLTRWHRLWPCMDPSSYKCLGSLCFQAVGHKRQLNQALVYFCVLICVIVSSSSFLEISYFVSQKLVRSILCDTVVCLCWNVGHTKPGVQYKVEFRMQ